MLVTGSNYGFQGKVFHRNVPREVTPEARVYLLGTGRFRPTVTTPEEQRQENDEIKIGKGIVIKHSKKKVIVGEFSTKDAAAKWADKNFGVDLNKRLALRTLNGQCLELVGGKVRGEIKGAKIIRDAIPVEHQTAEPAEHLN